MFTGLVAGCGTALQKRLAPDGVEVDLNLGDLAEEAGIGDSIAVSGVCCTVAELDGATGRFFLSEETLRRTWLGDLKVGQRVNLELPLRLSDRLGGHLVQGHVDGLGQVAEPIGAEGGELWVDLPESLLRYCVEKGSITLDGVSLTIAGMDGGRIMVAVIPHTAQVTTLGEMAKGRPVHVEVDVLAKYVERLTAAHLQ